MKLKPPENVSLGVLKCRAQEIGCGFHQTFEIVGRLLSHGAHNHKHLSPHTASNTAFVSHQNGGLKALSQFWLKRQLVQFF